VYVEEFERAEGAPGGKRTLGWTPGTVAQVQGEQALIQTISGSKVWHPNNSAVLLPKSLSAAEGIPDMIAMDVLHIGALQENIAVRYARDEIYTYVGPILLSVNPYKWLPIYDKATLQRYLQAGQGGGGELMAPHIYAVADRTFSEMCGSRTNQSVLISGESGAGKTEATKIVLQYLMQRSEGGGAGNIQQQILDSNPVLEAFGNAKTVRNNNSSRFGKFFQVQFNQENSVVGGQVTKYLLEKSRVVTQSEGERNYHIFYHFTMGASAEERQKWHVMKPENYAYLSTCTSIDDMDDTESYDVVQQAMSVVGVSEAEQASVFRLLSGILLLGNVDFEDSGAAGSQVASGDELGKVAALLQVDADELEKALTFRTMSAGGARRRSIHMIPLDVARARDSRDALAKEVYGCLFDWLVVKVNEGIDNSRETKQTIGVLDIFGFEVFEVNSFEQLCINYANEKLHQQFVQYYFKHELNDYKAEGISIAQIKYEDNQACLDLIEQQGRMGKWAGVLSLLQEECRLKTATDKSLVDKINTGLKGKPHFLHQRFDPAAFGVAHFAGPVVYKADGFLEKNKDTIASDLMTLVVGAKDPFLKALIGSSKSMQGKEAGKALVTVASQFKEQVNSLVKMLSTTTPNYVRCIKPNTLKAAQEFHGGMVLEQLRYSGVLESIEIRKAGYAMRLPFLEFFQRYRIIIKGSDKLEPKQACEKIAAAAGIPRDQWTTGNSKIFLKTTDEVQRLEKMAIKAKTMWAKIIQARARSFICYVKYQRLKKAAGYINPKVRGFIQRMRYRRQQRSAVRIQAHVRGSMTRKLIRASQAAGGELDAEALQKRMEEADVRRKEAQRERDATKGLLKDAAAAEADRLQDVDDILLDVETLNLKEINLNLPEVREVLARIAVTSDPKKLIALRQVLTDLIADMRQQPESHYKEFSAREAVIDQGWLLKKNLSSGKSKTRFCVLLPNRLLCYTSPECDTLCSEFNLKGCECVVDGGDTVKDPVYNHSFCVTTARHSVVLAAPTAKLKAKWIRSVQDCQSYAGPESTDMGILVRVGWVKKYLMTTKGWTNVYAVLRDDLLTFYSNEECDVEKGHCRIGAECRTDTTDRARMAIWKTLHAPTEWCFHIYAGSSQVYMCAASDSLMNGWVRDLRTICRRVKGRVMEQGSPWQDPASKSLKQGWLWYKTPPDGKWAIKYCVLTSTDFRVFENDSCMTQTLVFSSQGLDARGLGLTNVDCGEEIKSVFSFSLGNQKGSWEFAAAEEADFELWKSEVQYQGSLTRHTLAGVMAKREGWLALGTPFRSKASQGDSVPIQLGSGRNICIERWRACYCVLAQDRFIVYSDHTYSELRGEFLVSDCRLLVSGHPLSGFDQLLRGYDYVFEIMMKKSRSSNELQGVVLAAMDEQDMWDWTAKINSSKVESSTGMHVADARAGGGGEGTRIGLPGQTGPLKEGWLHKEAKHSKQWLCRYVVLHDKRLLYYADEDCNVLKGEFSLSEAIVRKQPEYMPGRGGACGNQITICSPARVVEFAADDAASAREWAAAIELAMGHTGPQVLSDKYPEDMVEVFFFDSSSKQIPVTETTRVSFVMAQVADKIGLKADVEDYALVELTNDKNMRILKPRALVQNLLHKWNQTVAATEFLKQEKLDMKILFMKTYFDPDAPLRDAVEVHLEYTQAAHHVRQYFKGTEEVVQELAALQTFVEYGGERPPDGYLSENFHKYIPLNMKTTSSKRLFQWECNVILRYNQLLGSRLSVSEAMLAYLRAARRVCPLYGSSFYEVTSDSVSLPKTVTLALNNNGILILERHSLDVLSTFSYEGIHRWGYKSRQITFHLQAFDITFTTLPDVAPEIALFVEEYIRRLVKKVDGGFV